MLRDTCSIGTPLSNNFVWYTTTYGSTNYRHWYSGAHYQPNYDNLNVAQAASSTPGTSIQVYFAYQTAGYYVFWWDVHPWVSSSFIIPYSQYS